MTTDSSPAGGSASQPGMDYDDFHLRLDNFDAATGTFRVSVANLTPAGNLPLDQAAQCTYDPVTFWGDPEAGISGLLGELDEWAPDLNARLLALGTALADLALPAGPVRDLFQASRDALSPERGLRLWLEIEPSPLRDLPWEYLVLPGADGGSETPFMGLRRDTSVVRGAPGDAGVDAGLPDRGVVRVVGVAADDAMGATPQVDLAIDNLNQAAPADLIELTGRAATDVEAQLARSVAGADFFHLLAAEPTIDTAGHIRLTGDETFATTRTLGRELREAGVRLAFLQALQPRASDGASRWDSLATALTDAGVPAVIVNQFPLDSALAIRLLVPIYQHVLGGYTVDEALYAARQSIAEWSDLAWAAPALYLRARSGRLFTAGPGEFRNVMQTFSALDIDPEALNYGAGPPVAANGPPSEGAYGGDYYDRGPGAPPPPEPPREEEPEEAPPSPPQAEAPEQERWMNAEIDDHPATEPLRVGRRYTLAFDVDTQVRDTAVGGQRLRYDFEPEEQAVELSVQLQSDDFTIHTGPQSLTVPRSGPSPDRAAFQIEPLREGEGIINAVFLKDRNYVQSMTLKLKVGGAATENVMTREPAGRSLGSAGELQPRDLLILVGPRSDDVFPLTLVGPVADSTRLPFTLQQLDQLIEQIRDDLEDIVYLPDRTQDTRPRVYQEQLEIPDAVNQEALQILARRGFQLYRQLFYGPGADAQRKLIGDRLRDIAQGEQLKIQIVSQGFPIPWDILYMADRYDPDNIDLDMFLGFKHIIERIPRQSGFHVTRYKIPTQPPLTVSVNVNRDIDTQMQATFIEDQLTYWKQLADAGTVNVAVRETSDQVTAALAATDTPDQIAYFNCHAESKSLVESGGPEASTLIMTGDGRLTLADLNLLAPTELLLPGAPLVFINACQSARLSPLFYDGFVPYFMGKGARGVIGTECEMPALFAAEFAHRFFDRFLAGGELGEVMRELRREFHKDHNNILGLLYAVYCDADTLVVPGIELG